MQVSITNRESIQSKSDIDRLLQIRETVYSILWQLLYIEPDRIYLSLCAEYQIFQEFPLQNSNPKINRGIKLIDEYFTHYDPVSGEQDFSKLHWDFTKLFIGPFTPTAAPWASYYLEKDRLLFQGTTLQVRELYRKYGYSTGQRCNVQADDHIALEFEFLQKLSEKTKLALKTPNESHDSLKLLNDQISFIDDHILHYVGSFSEAVIEHADHTFYQGISLIAEGFVEEDSEIIKSIVQVI